MNKGIIQRLTELKLFKQLIDKEEEKDHTLSALVLKIIGNVAPLMERVPENMPEYTLHDPEHGAKVAENMGKIIPGEVLQELNVMELTLLLLSAYVHDIGMTCSRDEKLEIIGHSEEFTVLFRSDIDKLKKFEYYKNAGDHRSATFMEDQVFTEYLRQNHVRRSAHFIREKLSSGNLELSYKNIPFYDLLISVCDAHGEPVSALRNSDRWPRDTLRGGSAINVQYLGLVLRLADLLDFDAERTPKMIYEFVNPKDPVSIIEWKKHRSIIGHMITSKTVRFVSRCSSPEVERALKQFIYWMEEERGETIALLRGYTDDISKRHFLELNEPISIEGVKSDGSYISNDLRFQIDYQRVLDLLIGERLYKNPIVALRELLQNATDAIKIRQKMYETREETFSPLIKVKLEGNELVVTDNGVGMDKHIFADYFLQVGRSYYSSKEFYGKYAGVDVTSEFGIGVLSCFMIAYSMVVESRRESADPLKSCDPIQFEIPTAYSYLIERKSQRAEIGTRITLKLKNETLFQKSDLLQIIQELSIDPPFPIQLSYHGKEVVYTGVKPKVPPMLDYAKLPFTKRFEGRYPSRYSIGELSFVDIDFAFSKNSLLKDIEGHVAVVNTAHSYVTGGLSQRNFKVGIPAYDKDGFIISLPVNASALMPQWMTLSIHLNLTRSACLAIYPDRTDVIADEKYKTLKVAIEEELIEKMEEQLATVKSSCDKETFIRYRDILSRYVFFNLNRVKIDKDISRKAALLLDKIFIYPTITPDGEYLDLTAGELTKFERLGYVSEEFGEEYLEQARAFCKKEGFALITYRMEYPYILNNFMDCLRLFFGLYGGQLMDERIEVMDTLPDFAFRLLVYDGFIQKEGYILLGDANADIFMNLNSSLSFDVDTNWHHPFFDTIHYADGSQVRVGEMTRNLEEMLTMIISDSVETFASDSGLFQEKAILTITRGEANLYPLLKGVFQKDEDLLNNINREIKRFYADLRREGFVIGDSEPIALTEKDFLPYWNEL